MGFVIEGSELRVNQLRGTPRCPLRRLGPAGTMAGLAFVLRVVCATAQAQEAPGARFDAQCVRVIDGDTIEVLRGEEKLVLRLEGIDAPERRMPMSLEAEQFVAGLAHGKTVHVIPKSTGLFGRTIARVLVNGVDISEAAVRQGFARHYTKYSSDPILSEAERKARAEKRGIWSVSAESGVGEPLKAGQPDAAPGLIMYHGNTSSKVFHAPGCRYYECENCTRVFRSRDEAIKAGYRPGGHCNP